MFGSKMQNLKEAAYFDYFKSFSLNAFDTIKKLQNEFKDQISDNFFFQPNNMFKRVKTLLGSYEILVLEINDSCEFVEIPQFGSCILKIFLQIMSIIKFLLRSIIVRAAQKQNQRESVMMLKKDKEKQATQKQQTPLNNEQRLFYKQKQQSRFMFDNINNELSLLQDEHALNVQNCNKNLRVVIEGKQKLQSIQVSQNQSILSQTLNSFYKKGEHLNNFVNIRQAAMMTNMREGISDSYLKVKEILDQDSNQKLSNASHKLQQIFKIKIDQYFQEKQSKMISFQCQAVIQQSNQERLLEQSKHIRKISEINKKLQSQIKYQRDRTQSLQKLLKEKTQEFQLTTMQYRLSKIQMDNKLSFIKKNIKTQSQCDENITAKNKSACDSIVLQEMNEDDFDDLNNLPTLRENDSNENQQNQKTTSKMFQKKIRRVQCRQRNKQFIQKNLTDKIEFLAIQNMVSVVNVQPQLKPSEQPPSPRIPSNIFSKKKFGNSRAMSSTTQHYQMSTIRQSSKKKTNNLLNNSFIFISNLFSVNINNCRYLTQKSFSTSSKKQMSLSRKIIISQKRQKSAKKQVNTQIYNQKEDNSIIQNFQISNLQTYKQFQKNLTVQQERNSLSDKINEEDIKYRQHPIISIQKKSQHACSGSSVFNSYYLKKKQANAAIEENKELNKGKSLSKSRDYQNSIFQASESLQNSYINKKENYLHENSKVGLKYPKFCKLDKHIEVNFKDIQNVFFDELTAQNFQYVNLYQAQEKTNKKNVIQVAQMQKKNLINLLSRVGNQTCKSKNNLAVYSTSKENSPQPLSLNGTLGKSSTLWNTLKFGVNLSKQINAYDSQKLSGMIYKQLKDIKKSCKESHLNNYSVIRNFLRYPFSTIKLSKDQKFIQKQKGQPQIQYLQLRKIMQRIFKLHANCWKKKVGTFSQDNKFQKLNFPQDQTQQVMDGQVRLCDHLIAFYQKLGIVLPFVQ